MSLLLDALDTQLRARAPLIAPVSDLWRSRELLRSFVARDLKARYRNSTLGFLWSFGNPLLLTVVFTIVFTTLLPQNVPNYHVFVLIGLVTWNWFAATVSGGVHSVTGASHLIRKVAFTRETLPVSLVLSSGVHMVLAFIPVLLIAVGSGVRPSGLLLLFPLVVAIQAVFLSGVALLLACANVYFRDIESIVDVALLACFFLTPVFYAVESLTTENTRLMYILNPMASFISTYRLLIYHDAPPAPEFILRMAVQSLLMFAIGLAVFRWRSGDLAEVV